MQRISREPTARRRAAQPRGRPAKSDRRRMLPGGPRAGGNAVAVVVPSTIARGRVSPRRRNGRDGARRHRGDDASKRAARQCREEEPERVHAIRAAGRLRSSSTASRSRSSMARDVRTGDSTRRPRSKIVVCRRCAGRGPAAGSALRPEAVVRRAGDARRGDPDAAQTAREARRRRTARRPNTTTQWSRTRHSRRGTATT